MYVLDTPIASIRNKFDELPRYERLQGMAQSGQIHNKVFLRTQRPQLPTPKFSLATAKEIARFFEQLSVVE
jgi:hypothetical protein